MTFGSKHRPVAAGVLCAIAALISTAAVAQQEIKPRPKVSAPAKAINPRVADPKQLEGLRSELLKEQLSPRELESIRRAHDRRVQQSAVGTRAKANTRLAFKSQNNRFRGEYDCDDSRRDVNPGESERCDGIDNDCDGDIDEGVSRTFFLDADRDGWGDRTRSFLACSEPEGYSSQPTDCDDTNPRIRPGADDIAGNNIDENCDGRDD